MRVIRAYQVTCDSRTYKAARALVVGYKDDGYLCHCPYCRHVHCGYDRSWKRFRRCQYKGSGRVR